MAKQFKVSEVKSEEELNPPGETTVESVAIAMDNLFHQRWILPKAAHYCGMTKRELKMAFWEYLRRKPPIYLEDNNYEKPPERQSIKITID